MMINPPKIQVDYEDGLFLIKTPFALNYLVQEFAERKWDRARKVWRVPASWRIITPMEPLRRYHWTDAARIAFQALGQDKPVANHDLSYPEDFPFKYKPFDHQIEGYRKAYNSDYFAFFFEQGLGKTKEAIDLACMWKMAGIIDSCVVVCPLSISLVWRKEMVEHCILPYQLELLKGFKAWKTGKGNADDLLVCIVGVESLSRGGAWEDLVELKNGLGKVCLIVDESSRIKNHKATRTQRVIEFATGCQKRLILSGTPVTQGLQDLYSQFQALSPSTLALTSFYAFRNRYCVMGGYEDRQIVAYRNVPELMGLIEPWSLRKEKEDCLDLPPKTYETRSIEMAPAQKKAYKELKKTLETTIETEAGEKNHIEVDTVLEAYLRLQQITGGFYPKEKTHDDGKPTVQLPIPGANPKLIELLEILDDFKGRKVIIWARFRAEIAAIVKAISDRNVVQFHGGLNMEQKTESVSSFQEGDADVFVATPASGAYGLTLTAAHTAIYYSMSFSLEEYLQSQDRIHRIGQTIACSYIMLGCSGTVDMNVMSALMEKKSLADFVNDRLKHGADLGDIF